MYRGQWGAKTKACLVLEGLQGEPVAEIWHERQISQFQCYEWRDQFLAHAANAFEAHQHARIETRLAQENARLKTLVGELTLELKTGDELWG